LSSVKFLLWCLKFKEFSLRPLRISAFSALKAA
jgi:hypothetical protein